MPFDWSTASDTPPSGSAPAPAKSKFDWSTASDTPPPPPKQAPPVRFPYDEPGYRYGELFDAVRVKLDKNGEPIPGTYELAWPESIRAPIRGMIEGGKIITGEEPFTGNTLPPDVTAAATTFGLPGLKGVSAPAKAAEETLSRAESKAVEKLAKRFKSDESGGGTTGEAAIEQLKTGRAAGKPTVLADVGGKNVQKMAGSVARAPGEASEFVSRTTQERIAGAGPRLTEDVAKYVSGGNTRRQTYDQLTADQKAAATPLYEEAFKPGSVAPLEKQFEGAFDESSAAAKQATEDLAAAHRQMTLAAAEKSRAGDNVYMASRALQNERNAQFSMQEAQKRVTEAQARRDAVLARLREAQTAAENGDRGGVWSPRVQQFLDDPTVRAGIGRGLEIQRLEALAEGRPFNPTDYAVDPQGNVISVPNMRLLNAVKRGIDAQLQEYRDPMTGKLKLDERGRALEMARKAYLSEVDRINPSYAEAREIWSGPEAIKGAMLAGEKAMSWHPEDIQKYVSELTESEKQAWRIGLAQHWKDQIASGSITSAEVRKLSRTDNTSMMKERLRAALGDDENFNKFVDAVTMERTAQESSQRILKGSPTAERVGDDASHAVDTAAHGARAVAHALGGNPIGAVMSAMQLRQQLGLRLDPQMNAALAKLLYDPELDLTKGPGLALLRKVSKDLGIEEKGAPSAKSLAERLGIKFQGP